jgi:hypothetical protein
MATSIIERCISTERKYCRSTHSINMPLIIDLSKHELFGAKGPKVHNRLIDSKHNTQHFDNMSVRSPSRKAATR